MKYIALFLTWNALIFSGDKNSFDDFVTKSGAMLMAKELGFKQNGLLLKKPDSTHFGPIGAISAVFQ